MKGIVFRLLEEVVVDEFDERTWDALLAGAELEGSYTAVGSYPDEELIALVAQASARTGMTADEVVIWFGERAIPRFHQRYPSFFEGHTSARSMVLSLNDVIHPEVRKLFPGAYVPEFDFEEIDDDAIRLGYQSTRRLCSFAEGLILGAADHFGEQVAVVHEMCMKRGDERCVLACRFSR